jgi:Zn-dependent metalloprotease
MSRAITWASLAMAVALAIATVETRAQEPSASVREAIDAARRTNPQLSVKIDPATGLPSSITGLRPEPNPSVALSASRNAAGEPSVEDVRKAVEAFVATSELTAVYNKGNAQARTEITQVRRDPDIPGQSIAYGTQRVGNVPVFGSSAKYVVNPSLAVTAITASYSTVAIDSVTPSITEADAIQTARAALREQLSSRARDPGLDRVFAGLESLPVKAELVVFDPALLRARGAAAGPLRLTYMVSLDTFRVFVDAQSRAVVFSYRDHPSAMIRRVYDLAGSETVPDQPVLDEASNQRKDPLSADAIRAFINTGAVRDFYYIVLGRNSYDDNDGSGPAGGAALESYVDYASVQNAYWCKQKAAGCPKENVMVYGPGFAGALDVVGHEVTHGVIAHEADLVYSDEPGAVNESLADIFGTLIEFHANNDRGNWVIGEGLPGQSEAQPMRSLAAPHLSNGAGGTLFSKANAFSVATNRGQPEHYSEYVARSDPICETTWDYFNGCVHFNSGVLNKFAYMISEGGSQKDVTVTGIGRQKLARIAYRALTTRLNATSGLVAAADAFVSSCLDLAAGRVAAITNQDCMQVEAAQVAVGLNAGS